MIACIPAKSNSERIRGKNFKKLAGKPLFQWTVEAAIESWLFDRIVISSDIDPGIFMHSFLEWDERPKELCSNKSTTADVCKHILSIHPHDEFMLLLPTSPLRTETQIQEAYEIFKKGSDCLMSVSEESPREYLMTKKNNRLVVPDGIMKRRQQVKETYKHDGSIIVANREAFLKAGDFYKMSITPYVTNELDIDTQADFDYAEWRMR